MKLVVELDRFDAVERDLKSNLRQALSDGAANTQNTAQALAPVDTGRLRSSISTRETGPLTFEVYTNLEYAPYQEYGTRYQSGTSFMRPAYEGNRPAIIRGAETP